jgi:hypothetical protein
MIDEDAWITETVNIVGDALGPKSYATVTFFENHISVRKPWVRSLLIADVWSKRGWWRRSDKRYDAVMRVREALQARVRSDVEIRVRWDKAAAGTSGPRDGSA